MKHVFTPASEISLFLILLICGNSFSQTTDGQPHIEPYPVPEIYYTLNAPELPEKVLNYKLPYFPQQFYNQANVPSCGQASAIYYCMTYEFNRIKNQAADPSNTFSTLYTYFFLNYGNNYFGASSFDSWDIVMSQGHPVLSDFPEPFPHPGSPNGSRIPAWMSGYEKYYRAMKNRISGYYSLDVSTDEGLRLLQHYLHDHLRQEPTGGVAINYGAPDYGPSFQDTALQSTGFVNISECIGNTYSHSMTVVGYYPNTFYDFNQDGLITDTLDLNNDGIVNFRDNEKIFWVMANSYVGSYRLYLYKYDMLADCHDGKVYFPVPDTTYQPELTAKIRMSHSLRGLIKISIGISEDIESLQPEHIIDFPIFNFQGGLLPMQGDDYLTDADTLELGLDLNPLLKYIQNPGISKIFIIIDNASHVNGQLKSFSIIRYDGDTLFEYAALQHDTLIAAKEVFKLGFNVDLPSHYDSNLLNIQYSGGLQTEINTEFQTQLTATGGYPPYRFYLYREDEYLQELIDAPYDTEPDENSVYLSESQVSAGWPVNFAGEIFDTISIGRQAEIYFSTEEPWFHEAYPYEYQPQISYSDMEFCHYYPNSESFQRRISLSDSCLTIFQYKFREVYFKTLLYKNGNIQFGYISNVTDWFHSSYVKTRCYTYYSKLLPRSCSSEIQSTLFTWNPYYGPFSLEPTGLLTMQPSSAAGLYPVYIMVIDSSGNKAYKRIQVEALENSIPENNSAQNMRLFPNPANNLLNIKLTDYENGYFSIFDLNGRCVMCGDLQPNINISELQDGVYILEIKTQTYTKRTKFIKQNQ
ncbi:MAG: T9SS type A sorting domain-containing protein [Bacteroidales bacterium]|nr:T9SS type A sorting domain-containing protein [Bacteroidales bacterium]